MRIESVQTDINYVDNRIKMEVIKTVTDEKTNKQYIEIETYYQTYDKQGKLKTDETHSVDKKI